MDAALESRAPATLAASLAVGGIFWVVATEVSFAVALTAGDWGSHPHTPLFVSSDTISSQSSQGIAAISSDGDPPAVVRFTAATA